MSVAIQFDHVGKLYELGVVGTGFHPEMTGRENIYMSGKKMLEAALKYRLF